MEPTPKDTDTGPLSPHHTLGASHHQSAPGDHVIHPAADAIILTGAKGGSAIITSIVAALKALGCTDSTT